ncbi:MAG: hypothetical protein GX192_05470 [Clostridiales bacterium]|nr:hypothetical protein [Clostridiales bacterium]
MRMQMRMRMMMHNIMYSNESSRAAISEFLSGRAAAHTTHAAAYPYGGYECGYGRTRM